MRRWIIVSIIAVSVVGVMWAAVMDGGAPVNAARATRGTIREYIDERGQTRLPRVYRISTPQAGRIGEITLEAGDAVEQGQVVAQMTMEDLDNAVAEATAVVERLDAAIAENDDVTVETSLELQAQQFVESMNSTVDAAETQRQASSKRSEFAETNLGRVQRLHVSNARTDEDLDRAQLQYWEGQLGYRQDSLTWEAMKSIRAATALLPKMVSDYISRKGLTRAVLEKQKSEAMARLKQIKTQRERGTMRSPIDGVVLSRPIQNEQQLSAGTELLRIGTLSQLEVEADILSQDVVRVREGDPVEIYGPALQAELGAGVPGKVDQIRPEGFTKISSLGVEQQRVKVIIRLDEATVADLLKQDIGVGFRVRVRIFTAAQDQALLVPRSALFRSPDGGWQLFAARGGRVSLLPVEVGLMNDELAEITGGAQEDEIVILTPDSSLQHGARVEPILRKIVDPSSSAD
jgi:HlyD family secretion protein